MISAPPIADCWNQEDCRPRSAFLASSGNLTLAVLLRMLAPIMPARGGHVLDIGGGDGRLAEALASQGINITIADKDPVMFEQAARRLDPWLRQKAVKLVKADAVTANKALGDACYDLVCCHSVLMYVERPEPVLRCAVRACRPGGHVSITSLDPRSSAMRPALQGRWNSALGLLFGAADTGDYMTFDHERQRVQSLLRKLGCPVVAHFGLGVFCDHYEAPLRLAAEQFEQVVALETLAGSQSPYREVARCFHLVGRRLAASATKRLAEDGRRIRGQ